MRFKFFFLIVSLLVVSADVFSQCTQTDNEIGLMGLDSADGTVYAGVKNHNNECGCSRFRFAPENSKSEMALSILATAKITKSKVRVDVSAQGNCNSAFRVYLQE